MSDSFTTPKGTVLPLLSLQGKPYLQPAYRLIWFREEHPKHAILSKVEMLCDGFVKAEVTIQDENGREVARANSVYKFDENAAEGAETGAMGRALAWLGYGTQFTADKEDSRRPVVDAPLEPARKVTPNPFKNHALKSATVAAMMPGVASGYVVPFGKHKGKTLAEITKPVAEAYADWLMDGARKDGKDLAGNALEFVNELDKVWPQMPPPPPLPDSDEIPF